MSTEIVQAPPEPVHLVALSGIHTLDGQIRYACEHNQPNPTLETVQAWLARYGVHITISSPFVSGVVNGWRAEQGLSSLPAWQPPTMAAEPIPQPAAQREALRREAPAGAKGFYAAAFLSMLVSVDTSWRFFGDVLHITDLRERVVMFAVLEVALVACGYGMRANVHRSGRPGSPRLIAWLLCGLAAYMAWQLSGFADGLARVALGPVLGLVMLDRALGIERRAGQHKTGTWARVGRELRERVLSRLGLSDDERDALARTRDRAARRVARLSLAGWVVFRAGRVARALRASNIAHDPAARARMLTELAVIRHANELTELDQPSPWHTGPGAHPSHEAADDTSPPQDVLGQAPHDVSHPAGDTRRVSPALVAGPAARTRTRTPKATREPRNPARNSAAGKGKARPTREEYLARARAALADSEPATVTAQWVQAVVPGISRSMSYVIADALSTESSSPGADASVDGSVDGVRGRGLVGSTDGAVDGSVDMSGDVSVDTDRPLSLNGGAR